jgi:hypothetical protein
VAEAPRFGEKPLPQTIAAAGVLRRLTGLLLSLENDHPTVDEMLARCAEWEDELARSVPASDAPRIGDDGGDGRRLYLDHAFDVGAYNPCFPEYRFDRIDANSASGAVSFPLVYEGPPGLVHGGFLGVFFDCVVQQHNCATTLSGKTRSLTVKYRRPTPILVELRFEIVRRDGERGLTSTATLALDGEVLCVGVVETVALPPEKLTGAQFGARRPEAAHRRPYPNGHQLADKEPRR